jgi:hypothetical protein
LQTKTENAAGFEQLSVQGFIIVHLRSSVVIMILLSRAAAPPQTRSPQPPPIHSTTAPAQP